MIKNIKWTSLVEAMIVMLIVIVWVVWMYNIYWSSQKLSDSTANRLQAISIAREWIEAMMNIRDTNWILFAANTNNCRNSLNYNSSCILWVWTLISSWSYIIYKNTDDRWTLSGAISWDYTDSAYRNNFLVKLDSNWFYTQSWWIDFKPLYTREIKISYPSWWWTSTWEMNVESIVKWSDSAKNWFYTINLNTTLTNWKK